MLSRARTRPSHSLTRATKGFHRIATAGVAIAGALGSSQYAKADKFVDPSMSYQTVNSVIDSATSGETVHFAPGTYQLSLVQGASYILNRDSVNLEGDGASSTDTILRGQTITSGAVLRIYSIDNTVSNLTFENGKLGTLIDSDFDPSFQISIMGNTYRNLDTGIIWQDHEMAGDNTIPILIIEGNYFDTVSFGQIFDKGFEEPNNQTAWARVSSNTHSNLKTLGFGPPRFSSTTTSGIITTTLGLDSFDGNIFINSDGVPLPPDVYNGTVISARMGNVAAEDFPDGNGEFQIGLNPDPSFPYTSTLKDAFGGSNFVVNPRLTKHARPILPSPAVGPQFGPIGHAGAFYPAGDIDNDNHLTAPDLHGFRIAYDDPNPNTLITSIFDFNGDDLITMQDFPFFKEGYEGPTHFTCEGTSQIYTIEDIVTGVIEDADQDGIPELNGVECQPINVPAASAWTLISMALLTAISGTLILRTRKVVGSAVRTILE